MNKSSLRKQLVLPYVALVVFVSVAIGWVSSQAGDTAVKNLSQRVLTGMVDHISSATEQHLAGASKVINAVHPDQGALSEPQPFAEDTAALEARLWTASGLFKDVNNYVYFGDEDGRFIGVRRVSKDVVELRLREPGTGQRKVYATSAPGDRSQMLRTDEYDPRTRPWYAVAAERDEAVWSPVYSDFTYKEPTITLARVCVLIALVLGLSVLNRILRDIRVLTDAARKIGEGEPLPSMNIHRRDEIGQLAISFSEMEHNLRIDKLTAVFNRASLIAQIAFLRRQLEQKSGDRPRFALLFVDLDHLKIADKRMFETKKIRKAAR